MKILLIVLAIWPGAMLAQSCSQELDTMKKEVKEKEKECKNEKVKMQNLIQYRKKLADLKAKYEKDIAKLKKKYGVKE